MKNSLVLDGKEIDGKKIKISVCNQQY